MNNCTNCGHALDANDTYCKNCGQPINNNFMNVNRPFQNNGNQNYSETTTKISLFRKYARFNIFAYNSFNQQIAKYIFLGSDGIKKIYDFLYKYNKSHDSKAVVHINVNNCFCTFKCDSDNKKVYLDVSINSNLSSPTLIIESYMNNGKKEYDKIIKHLAKYTFKVKEDNIKCNLYPDRTEYIFMK